MTGFEFPNLVLGKTVEFENQLLNLALRRGEFAPCKVAI